MKNSLTIALLLGVVLSQVACSDKEKSEAVAYCQNNSKECAEKYIQIAGGAAATGTSQVAASGDTVSEGQVPSTSILPASVTKEQIEAKAAEVQAKLKAYEEGDDVTTSSTVTTGTVVRAATTTTNSLQPSSVSTSGGAISVEIGVTRLADEDTTTATTTGAVQPEEFMDNSSQDSASAAAR